jgi:hypothetical protein
MAKRDTKREKTKREEQASVAADTARTAGAREGSSVIVFVVDRIQSGASYRVWQADAE